MKFIGQYIQGLIARFRNDVYLEDVESGTIASGGNLGLDSNNKIVKQDDAGITDLHGAGVDGAANQLLTDDGDGTVTSEANLTFTGTALMVNRDGGSPTFTLNRGGTGGDNDILGAMRFSGTTDTDFATRYVALQGKILDASNATPQSEFTVNVFSDSTTEAFKLSGDNGSGRVDVNLAAGAASVTTVAGTLTMGSTATIDNSGVIQVATQGTIDHDSLANFVAAEHYRWDTDISSTATIHTNNITDLHGAGVDGSNTQLLTDDGDGTISSESELTYIPTSGLTVNVSALNKGSIQIINSHDGATGGSLILANLRDGNGLEDADVLGNVVFKGEDAAGASQDYGSIVGSVVEADNSAESGQIAISVANDGTLVNGITMTSTSADEVDVTIANRHTSVTAIAGTLNMGTTATLDNSGILQTAAQTNITSLGTLTNLQVDFINANASTLTITDSSDTGDLFSIATTTHGATTITTTDDDAHAADLTFVVDGFTKFDSADTNGGGVEIENGSASGNAALTIDNDDVDQHALHVDAANTTTHAVRVDAKAVTTKAGIFLDCDALTTGTAFLIDVDDVVTTTATKSLIQLDYLKPETGASQISTTTGLDINFNGGAGVHGSATVNMTGVDVSLDVLNNTGTVVQTGYSATLTDGDVATTVGYFSNVEDGGIDFKAVSSADTGDMFTMSTTTHGATTLTTVDDDAAAADFTLDIDGDIILDPAGKNIYHKVGGTTVNDFDLNAGTYKYYFPSQTDDYFEIGLADNGATTLTTVDAAAAAAHFEVAADGDITLDAAADIALEAGGGDVNVTTDTFAISSTNTADPLLSLSCLHAGAGSARLDFIKDKGDAGADDDLLGIITFKGDNTAQEITSFASITAQVSEAADTDEAGKLTLSVAESDGSSSQLTAGLILEGEHATDGQVDVTIAAGAASTTDIAGTLSMGSTATLDNSGVLQVAAQANITSVGTLTGLTTSGAIELGHATDTTIARSAAGTVTIEGNQVVTENKQLHVISSNFFDDIGTVKHYMPISGQSVSEVTSDGNTLADFLVPCNTKVKEVMVKLPGTTTGSGDLTIGIETSDIGASVFSKSVIETETVTVASSNDNDIVHFMFDDTTHATIGKNLSISIQAASDLSGSQNWYVVVILEFDWSTRHTSGSAIQTS